MQWTSWRKIHHRSSQVWQQCSYAHTAIHSMPSSFTSRNYRWQNFRTVLWMFVLAIGVIIQVGIVPSHAYTGPRVVDPPNGSTITTKLVTIRGPEDPNSFKWIWVGSHLGKYDLLDKDMGHDSSVVVSELPRKGRIYVRYWTKQQWSGPWTYSDQTYTMDRGSVLISPPPGATLEPGHVMFVAEPASEHHLKLQVGGWKSVQNFGTNYLMNTRVSSRANYVGVRYTSKDEEGHWDSQYTNFDVNNNPSHPTTDPRRGESLYFPTSGALLQTKTVVFVGRLNSSDTRIHKLFVGTHKGGWDLGSYQMNQGEKRWMTTVDNLPTRGMIYARYWVRTADGQWTYRDHQYTMNFRLPKIAYPTAIGVEGVPSLSVKTSSAGHSATVVGEHAVGAIGQFAVMGSAKGESDIAFVPYRLSDNIFRFDAPTIPTHSRVWIRVFTLYYTGTVYTDHEFQTSGSSGGW